MAWVRYVSDAKRCFDFPGSHPEAARLEQPVTPQPSKPPNQNPGRAVQAVPAAAQPAGCQCIDTPPSVNLTCASLVSAAGSLLGCYVGCLYLTRFWRVDCAARVHQMVACGNVQVASCNAGWMLLAPGLPDGYCALTCGRCSCASPSPATTAAAFKAGASLCSVDISTGL